MKKTTCNTRGWHIKEKEIKLKALRRALEDGENSGYGEYSLQDIKQELDALPIK